ncbi:putative alpha-L-fucosidase [Rosa chinensis]|uniref:Putative alpha-L-fucosidase n=1 Tax=Rosa chinensis TaxID=74649 RepID=A0A2P6SMM4_ROSCH|nr:putative alpha-L-fucosidase [Rosa chinensis]
MSESVREIWFDGNKGPNAPNMSYYFSDWFSMVRELRSSISIFSDADSYVRWVGDEQGFAGSTSWSTINRSSLSIGRPSYLNTSDPQRTHWLPPECDVSIRNGWFWHKSESPKKLSKLLEIYYNSAGKNCVLLLNVPHNSTGIISEVDVKRLKDLRGVIDTIFSSNLVERCFIKGVAKEEAKT